MSWLGYFAFAAGMTILSIMIIPVSAGAVVVLIGEIAKELTKKTG